LNTPAWEIDDLLKVKADDLETLTVAPYQQFTKVPLNFPKLRSLQLRCPDLTTQIVDDLKQLSNLNQLALWDCKSGLERIKELNVDRIEVFGDCDRHSLEHLARELRVQRIQGQAKLADIEAVTSLLIAANNDRGLSLDLAAEESVKEAEEKFRSGSVGPFQGGAVPGFPANILAMLIQQRASVFQLDQGKNQVMLRLSRLELDDLVKLCRNATQVNVSGPVYDGDRMVLKRYRTVINGATNAGVPIDENFTTSSSPGDLFDLTDLSWEKLEPAIDEGIELRLVRPALSLKCWRRLGDRHKKLTVVWKELPKDYELVLEALSEAEVRFFIIEPTLTEDEKSVFRQNGHRVWDSQ